MKFQLRSLLLIIFLVFIICKSEAQVKTKTYFAGIPSRLLPSKDLFRKNISIKPAAEFIRLKKAVETDEAVGGINRYALPHNVNIDVLKEATLTEDEGVLIPSTIVAQSIHLPIPFKKCLATPLFPIWATTVCTFRWEIIHKTIQVKAPSHC